MSAVLVSLVQTLIEQITHSLPALFAIYLAWRTQRTALNKSVSAITANSVAVGGVIVDSTARTSAAVEAVHTLVNGQRAAAEAKIAELQLQLAAAQLALGAAARRSSDS